MLVTRSNIPGFIDFDKSLSLLEKKLFNKDFFNELQSPFDFSPRVSIQNNTDNTILKMEIPGMEKEDISIDIEDDLLVVSGEKKFEKTEDNKSFHINECKYGKFERRFNISKDLDKENIEANYKNGVLTIQLFKKEELKKEIKKIEIK